MSEVDLPDDITDEEAMALIKAKREEENKGGEIEEENKGGEIEIGNKSSISKFFGMSDKWHIQRRLNPAAQYQYAYVLLDTDNAASDLSSSNKFGWRFINYISQQTGTVSAVNNIRDVVAMRIFPVTMQLIAPVGEAGKAYTNPFTNINNNFTILIHEFQAQSFVGRDGRKFHFDLLPYLMNMYFEPGYAVPFTTPADPYFEFTTSGKGNGWFWFRNPITEFSTLTVSIGNPFDLVSPDNNTRTLIPIQFVYLAEKTQG